MANVMLRPIPNCLLPARLSADFLKEPPQA